MSMLLSIIEMQTCSLMCYSQWLGRIKTEYSMGICKRNSEIASLLGPNNVFSFIFFLFCNPLDYSNLKTGEILQLSRFLQEESSNWFPCYAKTPFLSMPDIYYIVAEGKLGATYLWFTLLDIFSCYRSTSCWLCSALPLHCCFPGLGIMTEAKRGLLGKGKWSVCDRLWCCQWWQGQHWWLTLPGLLWIHIYIVIDGVFVLH